MTTQNDNDIEPLTVNTADDLAHRRACTHDSSGIPARFRLEMYDFDLPTERIAQVPSDRRDHSRLMHLPLAGGPPTDHVFSDIDQFLKPGDCLVLNDTRVFPARIFARKPEGGLVELLALDFSDHAFNAMFKTHRGLRPGTVLCVQDRSGFPTSTKLIVESVENGRALVGILQDDGQPGDVFKRFGHMPLPPYIRRTDDIHAAMDLERYQTVYARNTGAVAAPTAGLHFTPETLSGLARIGVTTVNVTLHVGPGTFKPVRTQDVRKHDVGTERYEIGSRAAEAVNLALSEGRRVIAVGTTVVRALEAAGASGWVQPEQSETSILITPGYKFRIISGMLTNFHIPKSSLILLVSALAGRERILHAYETAVKRGYRFYSYGDSMLLL